MNFYRVRKSYLNLVVCGSLLSLNSYADDFIVDSEVITQNNGETLDGDDTFTVTSTGSIDTSGTGGSGDSAIRTDGADNTIINNGSIVTNDFGANGIQSVHDNTTIINNGSINTNGSVARSIFSSGDNAVITNTGTIVNESPNYSLYSTGSSATITNSGSWSTTANNASVILIFAISNTVNNSGTISSEGGNSHGVSTLGGNAEITNSNLISTTGDGSSGVYGNSNSANIQVTNTGTISTTGSESDGIELLSTGTITNSGFITTTGDTSLAINATDSIITSNSGTASTSGDNSTAISTGASSFELDNSGTVSTTGDTSHGIHVTGDNVTITNSGTISVTGSDSYAILGADGTDTTVNILNGSSIIGNIDLGGDGTDNDTVNYYSDIASNSNSTLRFANAENINLLGQVSDTVFVAGDTIVSVDAATESSRSVALSSVTSSINSVARQRMAADKSTTSVQVAALTLSPSMLFQERQPVAWAQLFFGDASYEANNTASAYDTNHVGIALGYEKDRNKSRVGVIGGIVNSATESSGSFESTTNSLYGGAYYGVKLGWVNLSSSVILGYANNDSEREVTDSINGTETATSDFTSLYISPSVTASVAYEVTDSLEIQPSASLDLTLAQLSDYTETGTTSSNLTVGSRNLQTITTTLQLATVYGLSDSSDVSLTLGISSRNSSDDDISASINGNGFSYSSSSNGTTTTPFVGLDFNMVASNSINISMGVAAGSSGDESYTNAHLDAEYQF